MGEQISELASGGIADQGKPYLAGLLAKIVYRHHGVVAPAIQHGEHVLTAGRQKAEVPPANLGYLFAHPDDAFHPVQNRVGITPLIGNIDVLKSVRTFVDEWKYGFGGYGESGI